MQSLGHRRADVPSAFRSVVRRGWLVILCGVAAVGTCIAASLSQDKEYTASAALLFRDPGLDQKLFGSTYLPPSRDPSREAATNVKLVSLDVVADRTAAKLGGEVSGADVAARTDVGAQGNSDVVSVNARARKSKDAAKLANTFAGQYIAFRRDADRAKIAEAQRLVERRLNLADSGDSQGRELQDQAQQLRVLASLQTGNAELVQPAKPPSSPSAPRTLRNSLIGGILGLVLGAALAVGLERADRRVRTVDDLENVVELPTLGAVPLSDELSTAHPEQVSSAMVTESFRMLRARLRYFNVDSKISTVMVTSALPGEGKSTIAWHLAAAAAGMGEQDVALVEIDLHRPTVASRQGLRSSPGLSELLSHDIGLETTVQRVNPSPGAESPLSGSFDVIVAGAKPPNPAALLDSTRMRNLLEELNNRYDLIVFDTPPASVVSDAIPLMNRVDGVIVVARLGQSTKDSVRSFCGTLEQLRAPVLGLIANSAPSGGAKSYGYGYYTGKAEPAIRV